MLSEQAQAEGPSARTSGKRRGIWLGYEAAWYAASFVLHGLLMGVLMLVGQGMIERPDDDDAISVTAVEQVRNASGEDLVAAPLSADVPQFTQPSADASLVSLAPSGDAMVSNLPPGGEPLPELGGLTSGSAWVGPGPALLPPFRPDGDGFGKGVRSEGFNQGRTPQVRKILRGITGGTPQSDRAVAGALDWLARHQLPDGRWSLDAYAHRCRDATCSGPGAQKSDTAATALALLPFLAAGETHVQASRYRTTVKNGLAWLIRQQKPNGDLSGTSTQRMYSHGLATILLCEAYGMTNDKVVGQSAQRAVQFIQSAQHPTTGGWRYQPGDEGDTSVFGWQVMALKSAEMSYLAVDPGALRQSKHWLELVAAGPRAGRFAYTPSQKGAATPSMTAVGLLCSQYLGARPNAPEIVEGVAYLMKHPPEAKQRSLYYWYYATQVLHNLLGPEWDTWNRQMRRILVESQIREGCAAGSWDPLRPTKDPLGEPGGRLAVTSLSVLTLEVYYRHIPLYRYDALLGGE